MFKLPIRTWILNAAAVFSGQQGVITRQAEQAGCSRETVYQHAHKLEQCLAKPTVDATAELRAEIQRLRETIAALQSTAGARVRLDKDKQRQLATTAFAMGLSLRQIEELLGLLLPITEVPDHATLGRWAGEEAHRAGAVLEALDPACAPRVRTLALAEIFFGGDRPRSGSSRRA